MLEELEKQNEEAVLYLLARGYDFARKFRRKLKRTTIKQQQAQLVLTMPNTREYCERLMNITTAGEWFRAGGVAMNCDDSIISVKLKCLEAKKVRLTKVKETCKGRAKQIQEARAVLVEHGKGSDDWRNVDVKKMIKWKDPKQAVTGNREILQVIWDDVKDLDPPGIGSCKKWIE